MTYKIAVLAGDGIGPEIMRAALRVLQRVAEVSGHVFSLAHMPVGGAAIDTVGVPLPEETLAACEASDAVLLGAVGGQAWDRLPPDQRPEQALLRLRSALGLYANLRPAVLHPALAEACPLKPEHTCGGVDLLIVRELIGGIYFGQRGRRQTPTGEAGYDIMQYSVGEVERIGRVAFALAAGRRGKLTSVDKANVLESSRLWREVMHSLRGEYPQVYYEDMFVDNAAMQLLRDARQFDVLVTGNMFGDILSDEASMVTGSIGMLPSASLGEASRGLYEPIHGSAPDIAGRDLANPLAMILAVAMMLRHSLRLPEEASRIEAAVSAVLLAGHRTADIASQPMQPIGTARMGMLVAQNIHRYSGHLG